MTKKPHAGQFKKGQSGNMKGRPKKVNLNAASSDAEKILTEDNIVFNESAVEYMKEWARAASRAGDHALALSLAEKLSTFTDARIGAVPGEAKDNELVIKFEEPEFPLVIEQKD